MTSEEMYDDLEVPHVDDREWRRRVDDKIDALISICRRNTDMLLQIHARLAVDPEPTLPSPRSSTPPQTIVVRKMNDWRTVAVACTSAAIVSAVLSLVSSGCH